MAKFGLPKGSGKWLKVREKSVNEKSGNFEMDIEWQPCFTGRKLHKQRCWFCI